MNRILIADAEPQVLRVLKMSLGREGYTVKVCTNGREGRELIQRTPPDVLITDIQIPVSIRELTEKLASSRATIESD
jgi:two-component system KDP operon response regulator KdpE